MFDDTKICLEEFSPQFCVFLIARAFFLNCSHLLRVCTAWVKVYFYIKTSFHYVFPLSPFLPPPQFGTLGFLVKLLWWPQTGACFTEGLILQLPLASLAS